VSDALPLPDPDLDDPEELEANSLKDLDVLAQTNINQNMFIKCYHNFRTTSVHLLEKNHQITKTKERSLKPLWGKLAIK
jgi:hypothetical protein